MRLERLHVRGLRHAEDLSLGGLDAVHRLPAGPRGVALGDALLVLAGTLRAARLPEVVADMGLGDDPEVLVEDGLPVQVRWSPRPGLASRLPADTDRRLVVEATVHLDPVLFGILREHAVREPRLALALGQGARLTVRVGWILTRDLTTAALAVHAVRVGDTQLPVVGERPVWLPTLLDAVGQRVGRVRWWEPAEATARRVLDAALGADPVGRARARCLAAALDAPPFSLGALELVRHGASVLPTLGPGLTDLRQLGPDAARALSVAAAACVDAPDILLVDGALPEPWLEWLEGRIDGPGATLEQVLVCPGGVA